MKNKYLILCLLAVIGVVSGGSAWWKFRDRTPAPTPTPAVSILGPSTVQVAELVVLVAEGKADSYAWLTVPEAQHRVMEGGKLLTVVFGSPGKYTAILGVSDNGTVTLLKHLITVEGNEPEPGPNPGPEPNPEPEPDPDVDDWVQWTYKTALATVTTPNRADEATSLAGQIRSVAAKIAAGAIHTPKEARVELRVATNKALGISAIKWAGFSLKFSEHCTALEEAGNLRTLKQYRAIYLGVAKGLDKVSKKKTVRKETAFQEAYRASRRDKQNLVVVITSQGCPPCKRLVSEYLPFAKKRGVFDNTHLVVLDRQRDRKAVQEMATIGMRGRIVTPQVQIQRYVNGKWYQFSKIGYTDRVSMGRWIQKVFSWQPLEVQVIE